MQDVRDVVQLQEASANAYEGRKLRGCWEYDFDCFLLPQAVHDCERTFACTFCEKKFFKKYDLTVHVRLHTGDFPVRIESSFEVLPMKKTSMVLHSNRPQL
jgi:hypothetical protein